MNRLLIFVLTSAVHAAVPANENLQYVINWPSGIGLGEGKLKANRSDGEWNFHLEFEAAIPGFRVMDKFSSITNGDQCSLTFHKELQHGKRKTQEKLTFDPKGGSAERETIGGGKSKFPVPACANDALSYLFQVRKEIAAGRVPAPQDVYYGAPYHVRLENKGSQKIKVGESMEDADRILANIKGPVSDFVIEVFLGKDEARTPLVIKVPLGMAVFSVELVR